MISHEGSIKLGFIKIQGIIFYHFLLFQDFILIHQILCQIDTHARMFAQGIKIHQKI